MADIQALAQNARLKLANGAATSEIDAIHKAIVGVGITNQSDLRRLKSLVGRQFARDKYEKRRRR